MSAPRRANDGDVGGRQAGLRGGRERTEVPDLKNGVTKLTETTEKTKLVFLVLSVASVTPFLRSGISVFSRARHAAVTIIRI
jgi:hypothetical protein